MINFMDATEKYFPRLGKNVKLFTGTIDTQNDLESLDTLLHDLEQWSKENYIIKDIDSWWSGFNSHISEKWNISDWKEIFVTNRLLSEHK